MAGKFKRLFENDKIYHIYNRGARKLDIFFNDANRQRFVDLLTWHQQLSYPYSLYLKRLDEQRHSSPTDLKIKLRQLYGTLHPPIEIFAYVLMPNHFHIVIKQKIPRGISKFMIEVLIGYSLYFNRKNNNSGSVFQGRFKSKEISDLEQLHLVIRYIHQNPLKANMIIQGKTLENYKWSSYYEYLNTGILTKEKVINPDYILGNYENLNNFIAYTKETTEEPLSDKITIDK